MANRERLLQLTYDNKLSHIGSCLTALPIIEDIYELKGPMDRFVLDEAHAGLALFVVLESLGICNAEEMLKKHGTHSTMDVENGVLVSGGSLGLAGAISLGMAISNKDINVFTLTSDGSMMEGIWWECLRIAKNQNVKNWKVYVNCNGLGAYGPIDTNQLEKQINSFEFPVEIRRTSSDMFLPFALGLNSHYCVMSDSQYEEAKKALEKNR